MKILVDSREQTPLDFSSYPCTVERASLVTGDYSLAGYADSVAIERKSLPDLVASLSTGRERFKRELERSQDLNFFSIVVEASMEDAARHRYRSKMKPHALLQSVLSWQIRYRCPVVWAGTAAGAAYCVFWTLQKWEQNILIAENSSAVTSNEKRQGFARVTSNKSVDETTSVTSNG